MNKGKWDWQAERFGCRVSFSGDGGLGVRDTYASAKTGALFHGGLTWLTPGQAIELGQQLIDWGNHKKAVAAAARARRKTLSPHEP